MPTSLFFGKYLVLPISWGPKRAFAHPQNAHMIIDYFTPGSTIKASSSNEPKKHY